MPPKSAPKSGKKRPQPYSTGKRQSARQVTRALSEETSGNQLQQGEGEQSRQQVNLINIPDTQNSTPRSVTHDRASPPVVQQQPMPSSIPQPSTSSSVEPQPSTSRGQDPGLIISDTLLQVTPSVSRNEFNQLKDSMSAMRSMMSDFMNKFTSNPGQASQQNIPQQVNQPTHAFQRPTSVPVDTSIIVQQPVSANNSDQNLSNLVSVPVNTDQAAASIVNQALSAHMQAVSGDKVTGKSSGEKSRQLDRKISQSLMQDIWEDNYIDLELLLDKKDDPTIPMMLKPVQTDNFGEVLQVVKPKPPKGITNIEQWSYAFDIFVSMYTRKYVNETHNLLTYSNKIKELASKGGDFLRYDEEFRKSRSRYGTPWEQPDLELWVECNQAGLTNQVVNIINSLTKSSQFNLPFQVPPPNQTFQVTPPDQTFRAPPITSDTTATPKSRHPNGACYTFHNKGRCGRVACKFSHLCYNPGCGQSHSVFTCPKSPGSGLTSDYDTDPSPSSSRGRGTNNTPTNPGSSR